MAKRDSRSVESWGRQRTTLRDGGCTLSTLSEANRPNGPGTPQNLAPQIPWIFDGDGFRAVYNDKPCMMLPCGM